MSDASEVKRWWVRVKNYDASPVKRDRDRLCCDYEPEPSRLEMFVEVMRVKDHDRIVADLRIKIRSLNLEIETRAKPTVEKLKNEITNLKAEIVRLSRPVSAVCTKCGYEKPANLYEQTIARQARVIEKLKLQRGTILHEKYAGFPLLAMNTESDLDKELEAVEQEQGEGM